MIEMTPSHIQPTPVTPSCTQPTSEAAAAAAAAARHPTPTLEEAYRLHHKRVRSICYKFVRSNEDAEDLTQDVFLHLSKNLHHFRGEARFTTWLHRITVNVVLMKIRGNKVRWRKNLASLEEMAENPDGVGALQRALACKDTALESSIDRAVVREAMERMPTGYRLALDLDLQGFTAEEVATMLGASVGLAKSQLHKARVWMASAVGATQAPVDEGKLDELLDGFEQYL